jgi:hypothetical protein
MNLQLTKSALEEQMECLKTSSQSGNERNTAVDDCLAGIDRLSHEVKDASSYIPAYDQRAYSQVITDGSCVWLPVDRIRPSKLSPKSFRPSATLSIHRRSSRSKRARTWPQLQHPALQRPPNLTSFALQLMYQKRRTSVPHTPRRRGNKGP